jgi:hypothetical protein
MKSKFKISDKIFPVIFLLLSFISIYFFNGVFLGIALSGVGIYYSFYKKQKLLVVANSMVMILCLTLVALTLLSL